MAISTLAVDGIADYMLDVSWKCVDTSSINPRFRVVASTKHDLASLFQSMGLRYCSGLSDIVQATSPPPITWFKTLPNNISRGYWGVYVLVLQKDGHRPCLYIGSGTDTGRGVACRVKSYYYASGNTVPYYVRKYQQNGYSIVHHCLLVWCPIPSPGQVPRFRTAVIILEATFTSIFWTLRRPEKSYGLTSTSAWPCDSLEWDGLGTHSPLLEGIRSNEPGLGLSSEELEKIAVMTRVRTSRRSRAFYRENRDRIRRRHRAYRQENRDRIRRYHRTYYQENRDRIRRHRRTYYQENRDRIRHRHRAYRQENRDRIRRHSRTYYQENRDRIRRRHRAYRQENRDRIRRHSRAYRQENRDRIRRRRRAYRQENRDRIRRHSRAYRQENRDRIRRRRRAYRQENRDRIRHNRQRKLAKKEYFCAPCNKAFLSNPALVRHNQTRRHLLMLERRDVDFCCEPCGKSFDNPSRLANHQKTRDHMMTILGIDRVQKTKPFKCEPCRTSYARPDHLAQHKRSLKHLMNTSNLEDVQSRVQSHVQALQDRGFNCVPCSVFCRTLKLLERHKTSARHLNRLKSLAETKDKPYRCEPCGFSTTKACNLKRHEKSTKHSLRIICQ
jgi:hypothetical protein